MTTYGRGGRGSENGGLGMGRTKKSGGDARSGFTTVEVMVALVIVLIALASYSRSVVSSMVAADTNEEVRAASEAARAVVERLQGADIETVWARYNADASDDPVGVESPGASFAVAGLTPRSGDPDGFVGTIDFPSVAVGGGLELREDMQSAVLGMPRDLDADGVIDAADHADDYVILPVRVRLEWTGSRGDGALQYQTLLSGF